MYKKNNTSKQGNYWDLAEEVYSRIDNSKHENYVTFMLDNEYIAKRKGINIKSI